jgi:hypothetical protein
MRTVLVAIAAVVSLSLPAVAQSNFVSMARASLPGECLQLIESRIAAFTTFQQITPAGLVRWSPRAIELAEFVKVASPTKADTYLYALRYVVSVLDQNRSLAVDGTVCQVTLTSEKGVFSDPIIVCEPVNVTPLTSH